MDQSRSRHSALIAPLIDRADRQSPRQRTLYGALTLAFWMFWFYLWLPVLALLAWALGVQQAYQYMVVLEGYQQVLQLLALYCMIILLLGGALILWASYSILRFRGVVRRSVAREITTAELAVKFAQATESVVHWQGQQRLRVKHDQEGRIADVEVIGQR